VTLGARSSLKTVALAVGHALDIHGIYGVLTGGACASIHTGGRYVSADADFILSGRITRADLDRAMRSVGFVREGDRYVHPRARFFVEFPRGPLAIGADHRIRPVRLSSRGHSMLVLSPTDSCRDRLAAFYHWNDRQSLSVAATIGCLHRLKWAVIREWSKKEGFADRFEEFRRTVRQRRSRRSTKRRR